jgi:uncharacterized damage-inducible protein DinB
MSNPTVEALIRYFKLNQRIIDMQIDGLTHEDSLIQPPFRGNCFNWVLGHIINERDTVLGFLGETKIWTKEVSSVYEQDSKPLTEADQALLLDTLLNDLDKTLEIIVTSLENSQPEKLNEMIGEGERERSIRDYIIFYLWHETYHVGQLELLRQLSGVNDAVL